jgi:hypothetical protein
LTTIHEQLASQHLWAGRVAAVKELLSESEEYLSGDYTTTDASGQEITTKHNSELELLGTRARQAIKEYLDYLSSLPDVR